MTRMVKKHWYVYYVILFHSLPSTHIPISNKYFHCLISFFVLPKSPHRTLETALPALAKLGYDGIEIPLKAILHYGKEKFKELINQCNLKVIVMVFTSGPVAPGQYLLIYYLYNFYNLLIY